MSLFSHKCQYEQQCTNDEKCDPARCHINFELQETATPDYDS